MPYSSPGLNGETREGDSCASSSPFEVSKQGPDPDTPFAPGAGQPGEAITSTRPKQLDTLFPDFHAGNADAALVFAALH